MLRSGNAAPPSDAGATPFRRVFDPDVSDDAAFHDLLAWWHRARGARPMPLRGAFDPVELRRHIGSLVLIECLPGLQDFCYRVIGTRITEAYGRDSTGRTLRELYAEADPAYGDFLLDIYRTVATRIVPARGFGTLTPVQRDYRRFDTFLLPLARADGSTGWLLNEVHFS